MPRKAKSSEPSKKSPPAYREGKKAIAGYYPEDVWEEFKSIGLKERKSMQNQLADALNLYFAARNSKKRVLLSD